MVLTHSWYMTHIEMRPGMSWLQMLPNNSSKITPATNESPNTTIPFKFTDLYFDLLALACWFSPASGIGGHQLSMLCAFRSALCLIVGRVEHRNLFYWTWYYFQHTTVLFGDHWRYPQFKCLNYFQVQRFFPGKLTYCFSSLGHH